MARADGQAGLMVSSESCDVYSVQKETYPLVFATTAFLIALPLAAAPILLHLFDRRRNVTIEWGAMEFLMQASTRKTSARKLKQWILLALRVLALLALVLALAQPRLPGTWLGSSQRSETVLVIDNSLSTLRSVDGATVLERLIDKAKEELENVKSGDTIRVLLPSPYPVWATAGSIRVASDTRETIAAQLDEIQPTNGSSDLLAALFSAVQADAEATTTERHIILLTDGQANDWKTDDTSGWSRFEEVLKTPPIPTTLKVTELDDAKSMTNNLSINTVRSNRTVVGVDQPFTVTAKVRNHSTIAAKSGSIEWKVGEDVLQSENLPPMDGGDTREPIFRHSFSETGVYSVVCQMQARDDLATDNSAAVVIEVVDEVPILVVDNSPDGDETEQDGFCLQAALGWANGERQGSIGVHRPIVVSPLRFEREALAEYRAVVIPNLQELPESAISRLEEFVFNGGGLWVSLGPRTDAEMFNQYFFADGDGLSPLGVEGIVGESTSSQQSTTINPFLRDHPATAALADDDKVDTGDVRISRRFRFIPPPQGEQISVLLSLTNSEPMAVENYFGRGRVIVQSVPLKLQWSGLAQSTAFVVMVQDWLSYLTQPQATRHNLMPGDPIAVHLADSEFKDATLRTPHGDEIELTADASGEGSVFRTSRTILPGEYFLELGLSGDEIPFHVERDPHESNLARLNADQQKQLANVADAGRNLRMEDGIGTARRNPVWHILLILLITFMTVELVLSGLISRERFGSAAISETAESFAPRDPGFVVAFDQKTTLRQSLMQAQGAKELSGGTE